MGTILEAAWETAATPRHIADEHVLALAYRLRAVRSQLETPLVTEPILEPSDTDPTVNVEVEKEVDVVSALFDLYARGEPVYRPATALSPRHKGAHESLEAFMLADRVAAGVAAAHEITSGEPVTADHQNMLVAALLDFRLRNPRTPGNTQKAWFSHTA